MNYWPSRWGWYNRSMHVPTEQKKSLTNFEHMVRERAAAPAQNFMSHGRAPSQANPLRPQQSLHNQPDSTTANSTSPPAPTIPRQNSAARTENSDAAQSQRQQAPTQQNQRPSERYAQERAVTDALKQKVDVIQLSLVMQMLGASGNQDNDRSKWKISGVGNITVNNQKWWNLQAEKGGIGAVGLVMHAKDLKFPLAVKWLADTFGESVDSDDIKSSAESMSPEKKKSFTPPPKVDKNIHFVKHYLKFTRRIPEELLDELIASGRIYADESKTCVFYSNGIAELRSSFDGAKAVKKLVPGSTRQTGFLVLPDPKLNEKTIAVCESAIDAMSYRVLNPGRSAISSAGANRLFPRAIAEDAVEKGFKVVAAFDADKAGDNASQALFNHFYLKLWLKHKCQAEMGRELEDDKLFELLNSNVVTFHLPIVAGEIDGLETESNAATELAASEKRNILFFNKTNPFDDPADPPMILVEIKRNDIGLPVCEKFPLEVSARGYEFISQKLGISRDRPHGEKDWNEMLKKGLMSKATTERAPPASNVSP